MIKNKLIIAIAVLLLSGCVGNRWQYQGGLGVHDVATDGPEFATDNPLGIVRANYRPNSHVLVTCEHISQLRINERGKGLNYCGYLVNFK